MIARSNIERSEWNWERRAVFSSSGFNAIVFSDGADTRGVDGGDSVGSESADNVGLTAKEGRLR
jgi:hypothetical protein